MEILEDDDDAMYDHKKRMQERQTDAHVDEEG